MLSVDPNRGGYSFALHRRGYRVLFYLRVDVVLIQIVVDVECCSI